MPYVFMLANINEGKTCLTYDEYVRYLEVWKGMSDGMKEMVMEMKKNMRKE